MKRLILLLSLLFVTGSAFADSMIGGLRTVDNPVASGNIDFRVNSVPVLRIKGSSSALGSLGGFTDLAGTGAATFPNGYTSAAASFLPNGTAAAPSLGFTNSNTTGFYRAGTDILGFTTAGVTAGNISATHQWTIGNSTTDTQSVNGNLAITGSSSVARASVEHTSDGTGAVILGNNTNAGGTDKWWRLGVVSASSTQFSLATVTDNAGSGPVEHLNISHAGSFTIGTSSTASISHVIQGGNNGTLEVKQDTGSAQIKLTRTGTSSGSIFIGTQSGDFRVGTTAGGIDFARFVTNQGPFFPGATDGSLAGTGNVGQVLQSTTAPTGVSLSASNTETSIATLSIPAGTYLAWANMNVLKGDNSTNPTAAVSCCVTNNGTCGSNNVPYDQNHIATLLTTQSDMQSGGIVGPFVIARSTTATYTAFCSATYTGTAPKFRVVIQALRVH